MTSTSPIGVIRTANVSGLGAVERELAEMHKAMLRAGGDATRAVRLSVMTLVIACVDEEEADRAADVVAQIAMEHPARALLVTAHRGGEEGIDADLRLECSVAGGPESQVCAEIVRLRVGGEPAGHLTSIVEPLLLPDVPVRLWLVGGPPLEQAFTETALALVDRIVLDSDAFDDAAGTLRALAAAMRRSQWRLPIADLAWLRLEPWREVIARAFDPAERRRLLSGIDSVRVRASNRASGLLGAGWLTSRLRLQPSRVSVDVEEGDGGRLPTVRIHASSPRVATIEVGPDRDGLRARVVDEKGVHERNVPVDAPSLAELVGAGLEEGSVDSIYAEALRAATDLAG